MRLFAIYVILAALSARAQLVLIPDQAPQRVFAGPLRNIGLWWHNPENRIIDATIQTRVMQLTSATTTELYETPWKQLRMLPGQTVVERASLDFPAVRGETRFLVQWIEKTNHVIGSTEVFVYPTNMLAELQPMVGDGDGALGILDPLNQLKPLLSNANVKFVDLGNTVLEHFSGKLAIVGPFDYKAQMDRALPARIKTLVRKGVAVVWIQPRDSEPDNLQPSFYSVPQNETAAVIVQPHLVTDPAENPSAQLNLIYFCKLALHPQPLTLPSVKTQP